MITPPKRHVRVFRIRPGRWSYLITGSEPFLPFQGFAATQRTALRRGRSWLRLLEMREPRSVGGWSAP